ncbi:MAG: FkbM family methyltransferase [Bacteroidota bacterium]
MRKILTYLAYLYDYLKHGDLTSVYASINYIFNKKSHQKDRVIITSAGTFFCRKNTNDFQFANYYYEWTVRKFFVNHHKEFSVFIDGGSCIGNYSVLMSGLGLRCIAFEPMSSNYDVLRKNLELNNLQQKVMALPYGLGSENTTLSFAFDTVNTGASHRIRISSNNVQQVEIRTFDSLLPELSLALTEKILFKLDVEGMESEAIQGAAQFIKTYPNLTFVIEDKHSGEIRIKEELLKICKFEFGVVDEFNIYARKVN